MPLTVAHPLLILPLRKTPLIFSALVIGSFCPDFTYFVFEKRLSHFGHTFAGAFMASFPVSVVCYTVFHLLIKRPLHSLLPEQDRERLKVYLDHPQLTVGFIALLFISLLIGVGSHNVWDSFTHLNGWSVNKLKVLSSTISIGGYSLPLYKMLQYSGHLFGVPLLLCFYLNWAKSVPVTEMVSRFKGITLFVSVQAIISVPLAPVCYYFFIKFGWYQFFAAWAGGVIAANFLLITLYSFYWHSKTINQQCN